MATPGEWLAGARPRTLPAAVVPVAVGTAVAAWQGEPVWWRAALALVVALALQVGVNYANDYSDGVRGTDTRRVGPTRLVAAGLATPARVAAAALVGFGLAAVAGAVLAAVTSWWLVLVGAAAILAAWAYTGGPLPYGYRALGELAVFAFFGVTAVVGTAYVQLGRIPWPAWWAAVPVGLLACALLVVNNLRDIPTDAAAGKRTLAVAIGARATRLLYGGCVAGAFAAALLFAPVRPLAALVLVAVPVAVPPVRAVLDPGSGGPRLVAALVATGRLHLAFGAMFALGLALP